MNALQHVIQEYLQAQGLSRASFVQRLGYRNINKALRALDEWTTELRDSSGIGKRVQAASDLPPAALSRAIDALRQQLDEKRAREFRPFIQVVYSGRPTPVFAGHMTGYIPVRVDPAVAGLEAETAQVFALYQAHQLHRFADTDEFRKGGGDYRGFAALLDEADRKGVDYPWVFGKGFRYCRKVDECLTFDRHGQLLDRDTGETSPD